MYFHLTPKSANVKTGPIPVATISDDTCPDACPFRKKECYAKSGPLALHWRKVSAGQRGTGLAEFCESVESFEPETLWRYAQAGDLPGNGQRIDGYSLGQIVSANRGRRGFTYSHYDPTIGDNAKYIKGANDWGFTVNLSANNLDHADKLKSMAIGPVVVVLASDATENTVTPGGHRVVVCPATVKDGVSCATCQLCQRQRDVIVGFPAHGTSKNSVNSVIKIFKA